VEPENGRLQRRSKANRCFCRSSNTHSLSHPPSILSGRKRSFVDIILLLGGGSIKTGRSSHLHAQADTKSYDRAPKIQERRGKHTSLDRMVGIDSMNGLVDPETLYTKQSCIGISACPSKTMWMLTSARWWQFWKSL